MQSYHCPLSKWNCLWKRLALFCRVVRTRLNDNLFRATTVASCEYMSLSDDSSPTRVTIHTDQPWVVSIPGFSTANDARAWLKVWTSFSGCTIAHWSELTDLHLEASTSWPDSTWYQVLKFTFFRFCLFHGLSWQNNVDVRHKSVLSRQVY